MMEKLVLDPFLKNQNLLYLWVNSLKFYIVCFYCMSKSTTTEICRNKVLNTCFYFI